MSNDVQTRVIAVTGASRGIGAAIALELARRGFTVACLTRSGSVPQGADAHQGRLLSYACDVNDEASVKAALAKAAQDRGLHGLVNNAGIHLDGASNALRVWD